MSKVSYINNSYGEEITFAIANTYGGNILKSKQLPPNTFIISSPVNKNNVDSNSPSIFYTDADGVPVRLTYNIVLGNGLTKESDTDIIYLNIDNDTVVTNSGLLGVNTNKLFKNELHTSGSIGVNVDEINIASETENGVVKIDGDTILLNGDIHYINTVNLNRATNETYGIVISDNRTINIENGVASVSVENLSKASNDTCGIIKTDNSTIVSNNGEIYVDNDKLPLCGNMSGMFGIGIPDNENISVTNGVLYVSGLPTTSSESLGIARVNGNSLTLENNVLEVKNYNDLNNRFIIIKNKIDELKSIIQNGGIEGGFVDNSYEEPTIFTFMCNSVSTKTLTKPMYGLFPDLMDYEKINISCVINTNCPFIINVGYENNITPPAFLVSVSYKNVTYEGDDIANIEFAPTYEEDEQINFEFYFKNVAIANGKQTYITKIHLSAHYSMDDDVYQDILYSIVRYNSMYKPTATETILTTTLLGAERISISNIHVINNEPKPYSGGSKISFTQHKIKK